MSKEKLAPKVRFEEFSAIWKYHGLLDSVTKVIDFRGRTPKKLCLDWSRNGFLALSALNVKNGYIDKDADAHYGDRKLYNKWMLGNELHKGQVLFTTEAPMGNVAQVPDNNKYILSQRTIAFEVKENWITEDYLAVVLRTPSIFRELTTLSSGGTAKGVSQRTLSELDIPIPKDIREQHKIGEFFKKIDKMIQLQQSKVNKVKDIKSAYLSEMFPKEGEKYPKKRFEGFTEPWYKNKFNEITEYITSSLSANNTLIQGRYELYDANELIGYTNSSGQKQEYVTIIKDGSGVGRVRLLPKDSNFIGTMGAIVNKEQTDIHYIYAYLQQFNFTEFITGATVPHVYYRDYGESTAYHPSYEEQVKIGKLFNNLDNQISIEAEKLTKLEKLKQAYLNDMFV